MAAPSKKRAVEDELKNKGNAASDDDEWEDVDGEEDMEDDQALNQEIQVDFEARTPEDSDFHGIRKLLQQLFLKANINLGEIVDTIISQNYVGSVFKQAEMEEEDSDEDDDVFGVSTVINITDKQSLNSVKEVKSYILQRCSQCASKQREKWQNILYDDNHQVGLLLNERFINIPPQLALPAFSSLWTEMESANQKKMKYSFSHYVMLCKTYSLPGNSAGSKMFVNAEEELFFQEADLHFEYSVGDERDSAMQEDEELEPFRTVLLVEASKIPVIMQRMSQLYSM